MNARNLLIRSLIIIAGLGSLAPETASAQLETIRSFVKSVHSTSLYRRLHSSEQNDFALLLRGSLENEECIPNSAIDDGMERLRQNNPGHRPLMSEYSARLLIHLAVAGTPTQKIRFERFYAELAKNGTGHDGQEWLKTELINIATKYGFPRTALVARNPNLVNAMAREIRGSQGGTQILDALLRYYRGLKNRENVPELAINVFKVRTKGS
ncbi:MAG: hypothetical protein ABL958_13680, partial [Bdellovibrionia bacterium]